MVFQKGLLSTPFHRVYFNDYEGAKVERLPETRFKLPIGLRFNYYATNFMILRAYYRYYSDTWGISAHTASLEVPFKITNFFSVYPWYRYFTQTGTDYFAPYAEHSANNEYYTSDYDLSAFVSHEAGIGLRYSPPMGLLRWKTPLIKDKRMLKSIEVRYCRYWRSDGMVSDIISLGIAFTGF
jgi:hypothetical protein